jgi:lipopolysaccharide transport system ATP-binding protein
MGKYYLRCYFSEGPNGVIFEILEDICPFEIVMHKVSRSKFQWLPDTCAYLEEANWIIENEI